jgi:hypothetical protein
MLTMSRVEAQRNVLSIEVEMLFNVILENVELADNLLLQPLIHS